MSYSEKKFVSIILPCYNESEHLEASIQALIEQSKTFNFEFEFIFVEDKSTDNTKYILKSMELKLPAAKFIYHENNKGRGAAVKSGFAVAKGNIIGFIDIDLEVSPRYINDFINDLDTYDVAIADRKYFARLLINGTIRNHLSNYYKALNRRILKHSYQDTEAGYKFFRREAVQEFFKEESNDHWFWDTEFMMFCFKNKLKVSERKVEFLRDNAKQSTVKILSDSLHYVKELFKLKAKLKKEKEHAKSHILASKTV